MNRCANYICVPECEQSVNLCRVCFNDVCVTVCVCLSMCMCDCRCVCVCVACACV